MSGGGSSIELWLAGDDERVAKVRLQNRVWEEFAGETLLEDADLRVEVADRVAVLDGTVDRYAVKAAAGRAARRVKGIRRVDNRIQVRPRAAQVQTDADLGAAAARAIGRSTLLAREPITVRVEAGTVTLGGEVSRAGARIAAEDIVSRLSGVTDVCNEIGLHPATRLERLRERIRAALRAWRA